MGLSLGENVKYKTEKSSNRNERHGAAWGRRVILLVALAFIASLSFGQRDSFNDERAETRTRKMAPELQSLAEQAQLSPTASKNVRVIVQFKQTPTQHHFDKVQARGGKMGARLDLVNGGAFSLPASALKDLADDDEVAFIAPDRKVQATDELTGDAINVSTARSLGLGVWGMGIGVAVIDSGINDSHDDLRNTVAQSRVFYHQDFTGTSTKNSSGTVVWDTYGHGTHVAGILAGDGTDSGGQGTAQTGISYGVNLIDLRVLNSLGVGSDSNVIAAIQKAIALKSTYNIRIINLSLGRPIYSSYTTDPLCQAVEQAWKAGITVVVAAGNYGRLSVNGSNGYGTVTAPGNDPYVITVGAMKTMGTATRTDDQIASYSSKGPTTYDHVVKPDIVAPGNLITSTISPGSTLATLFPGNKVKGTINSNYDYFVLSGSSMATPVVSGVVAMLLQQNSALTPDQIKARLMKTAYKTFPTSSVSTDPTTGQTYTSYYDLFTVGAGYLDIAAAVANTDKAPATVGSAFSPYAVPNSNGTVSLVDGNSSVAGSSVVWGNSTVWGNSVVWGTNVSGTSVVWGTASLAGSSVVWGNSSLTGYSVVWSTSSTAASSVVWSTGINIDSAFASPVGER